MKPLGPLELAVMLVVSGSMVSLSVGGWWSVPTTEVLGFATGGICVWLAVRENPWNWPVGLLNNIFFFVLFQQARLYADMALQVVYFALGVWGWANWLYGGQQGSELAVSRTTRVEWLAVSMFMLGGTWAMRELLLVVNGAAPFADALMTALSLAAQYLMCRKRLECWAFWIAVDVISVPLYVTRGLPLTAVLYGVFLVLCVIGWRSWLQSLVREDVRPVEAIPA